MRISDWSSDVCSSDLHGAQSVPRETHTSIRLAATHPATAQACPQMAYRFGTSRQERHTRLNHFSMRGPHRARALRDRSIACSCLARVIAFSTLRICTSRSEEHTSELQSLMRISYAVFCLKKKTNLHSHNT